MHGLTLKTELGDGPRDCAAALQNQGPGSQVQQIWLTRPRDTAKAHDDTYLHSLQLTYILYRSGLVVDCITKLLVDRGQSWSKFKALFVS